MKPKSNDIFYRLLEKGRLSKSIITLIFMRGIFISLALRLNRRTYTARPIIAIDEDMSVLNVAEKNDVAKHLSGHLSGGNSQRREGLSKFNKIYEFTCMLRGHQRKMIMTSVSGHLLNFQFVGNYKKWHACSPAELFDAPVEKYCPPDYEPIKRTLEREVRACNTLVIWTDCDREGENIGFEIISVCTAVKPNLQIFRAKFSEITAQSARRALETLGPPNDLINQAVEVRSELDLRIGAAFTRFQTMRLQRVFPDTLSNNVISYGSCQFPTLGFVVERYKAIERFVPESFWKIRVSHDVDDVKVEFVWSRVRLFDEAVCRALYERCLENRSATVESVVSKPKSKWRPLPLDTVEFEKLASRKLRMNAKEAMAVAEKLYTRGLISYPRTETNIFPKELDLTRLVEMQTENRDWGDFASRVLQDGPHPRQGRKTDEAHPPIHPTKAAHDLHGNEGKVYEFVVRHFLACVSKDAQGHETVVTADINGEKFVASGLMILARNYLDVYPYENWSDRQMHVYQQGQVFQPTTLELADGETSPPRLLTEADLIALMEKHGIGTDATHAEHIDKIKSRDYVGLQNNVYFVPGQLGMGLVDGYDDMGFNMSKPHLRSELEADLVRISNGEKDARAVLAEQVSKYRDVFRLATEQANKIDAALAKYLNTRPVVVTAADTAVNVPPAVTRCRHCGCNMVARQRANGAGWYLGCQGFPECRASVWFPASVTDVAVENSTCPTCGPGVKQLRLSFQPGSMPPYYSNPHVGCVNGCDSQLLNALGIQALSNVSAGQDRTTGQQSRSSSTSGHSTMSATGHDRTTGQQSRSSSTSGYSAMSSSSGQSSFAGNQQQRSNIPNNNPPRAPAARNQFQNSFIDNSDDERLRRTSWTMNDNNRGGPNNRQSWGSNSGFDNSDDICCNCGVPARKLKVMKESVNKGRFFYACSKQLQDKCDFFKWADEGEGPSGSGGGGDGWGGGGGGGGGTTRGRGGGGGRGFKKQAGGAGSQFRARPYDSDAEPRPAAGRKRPGGSGKPKLCSICREPGHTRVTCPLERS